MSDLFTQLGVALIPITIIAIIFIAITLDNKKINKKKGEHTDQ